MKAKEFLELQLQILETSGNRLVDCAKFGYARNLYDLSAKTCINCPKFVLNRGVCDPL